MKNSISKLIHFIFSNKRKILLTFVLSIVFMFVFFPKNELRDFIVSKVPEWTQNNAYVEFSNWSLSAPPSTGLRLENFLLELQKYPGVHMDELTVEPALRTFFSKFPLGHIGTKGIFHGDLDFDSQGSSRRSETGLSMEQIALDARNLSVQELAQTFGLGSEFRGQASLKVNGSIESTFQDQPDIDAELTSQKLEMGDTSVKTMMGPLQLPSIKLGQVNMKAKLSGGRLQIERFQISGEELQGTIKGGMSLLLQNNGRVQVIPGAYTMEFDLLIKRSLESKAALFLSFLDAYKTPVSGGSRYAFKISATSVEQPPAISALR